VTTAQERRRARRIARRAAQERGVSAAAPEVVVVVEKSAAPTAPSPRPAPRPVPRVAEHPPVAPPTYRNGMHHWVAVKSARSEVAPVATEPAAARHQKRWVAVTARAATAEGLETESPAPEPRVQESLEALPREPGNDTDPATAAAESRALHPRSRAIRITRVNTNGKRRWSVDFLVRGADMHLPRQ
jgi:hypothetical protein